MSDPATHEADCVCAACLIRRNNEQMLQDVYRVLAKDKGAVIKRVVTDGISTKDGLS